MTRKDHNGIRVKPGHNGCIGLPIGEFVWLLKRNDDKLFGAWGSRHDAVGAAATLPNHQEDWLDPIRVRAGAVRMKDVVFIN